MSISPDAVRFDESVMVVLLLLFNTPTLAANAPDAPPIVPAEASPTAVIWLLVAVAAVISVALTATVSVISSVAALSVIETPATKLAPIELD